jgi:short-subunit dehydrogenase
VTTIAGKNILLTGGSRGIGPIIAQALAKKGGHLALSARSEKSLIAVNELVQKYDKKSQIFLADLSNPNECENLISEVNENFGNIDILINNAGVETEGSYVSLPWKAIHETIEINLSSPMYLSRLVLPKMISNKSGHLVNISSIGGKCGAPYAAAYCATKAGLAEWSQAIRLELEGTGVKVSTIFPGYITELGMFAKFGIAAPKMVGSCTPAQVSNAVIRAIENNSIDVIVNSVPVRIMFAIRELFPSLGDLLLHKLGAVEFQRKKVGL